MLCPAALVSAAFTATDYDYILIDCMPSLGMLTINALAAADSVIVPVQAHYLPCVYKRDFHAGQLDIRRNQVYALKASG